MTEAPTGAGVATPDYTSREMMAIAAGRFIKDGDVLFAGSVGRTDLPGGSHATLIESITQKLLPLGDDALALRRCLAPAC